MPRPPSSGQITDSFGMRVNPVTGVYALHAGEDTAPSGNTFPVSGVVIYAEYTGGWGYLIGIRQTSDPNVTWWVAHNASIPSNVRHGLWGNEGDYLAPVGSTGNSTGPHAHTERRVGGNGSPGSGTPTDPRPYYTSSAGGGETPLPTETEEEMTYALRLDFADQNVLPAPKGSVFIGSGTDPLVWVSNPGPEQINGVVTAGWDAPAIVDRINQVGIRGSGANLNKVYKSLADARNNAAPVYTLGK